MPKHIYIASEAAGMERTVLTSASYIEERSVWCRKSRSDDGMHNPTWSERSAAECGVCKAHPPGESHSDDITLATNFRHIVPVSLASQPDE